MVNTENKTIAQILAERKEAKVQERKLKDAVKLAKEEFRQGQEQAKLSLKKDELNRILSYRQQRFILRWGLESIIQDISEFFGENTQVKPVRVLNMNYPSSDFIGFDSNWHSESEIDKSIQFLSKDNSGFSILIYSGMHPGITGASGKCIRFIELDNRHLLIAPGINWATESCPIVTKQTDIKEAYLSVFERGMENWDKPEPEQLVGW
jgi:hypothetical protein